MVRGASTNVMRGFVQKDLEHHAEEQNKEENRFRDQAQGALEEARATAKENAEEKKANEVVKPRR